VKWISSEEEDSASLEDELEDWWRGAINVEGDDYSKGGFYQFFLKKGK
jgi:hypothetical protein